MDGNCGNSFLGRAHAACVPVAVAVLSGYYAFRVLVFKVGLYDPIISFAPES
jgi:hypothetical protein